MQYSTPFFFLSFSGGSFPLLSRLKDESAARFPLRYRCAADKPFKLFNDTRILFLPVLIPIYDPRARYIFQKLSLFDLTSTGDTSRTALILRTQRLA